MPNEITNKKILSNPQKSKLYEKLNWDRPRFIAELISLGYTPPTALNYASIFLKKNNQVSRIDQRFQRFKMGTIPVVLSKLYEKGKNLEHFRKLMVEEGYKPSYADKVFYQLKRRYEEKDVQRQEGNPINIPQNNLNRQEMNNLYLSLGKDKPRLIEELLARGYTATSASIYADRIQTQYEYRNFILLYQNCDTRDNFIRQMKDRNYDPRYATHIWNEMSTTVDPRHAYIVPAYLKSKNPAIKPISMPEEQGKPKDNLNDKEVKNMRIPSEIREKIFLDVGKNKHLFINALVSKGLKRSSARQYASELNAKHEHERSEKMPKQEPALQHHASRTHPVKYAAAYAGAISKMKFAEIPDQFMESEQPSLTDSVEAQFRLPTAKGKCIVLPFPTRKVAMGAKAHLIANLRKKGISIRTSKTGCVLRVWLAKPLPK